MKKIRFSHNYGKLRAIEDYEERNFMTACLLDVFEVDIESLSVELIGYDTTYYEKGQHGNYPLPKKGKYLLLLFLGDHGIFTTLRADWPPKKKEYYFKAVGEDFEVIINDSKNET